MFLDRDGVLNRVNIVNGIPEPPKTLEEIQILDGVVEAVGILQTNNFLLVVVTNQPDVARGTTSKLKVDEINSYIGGTLGLQHFYTCFHDDIDLCKCRKPSPGLIELAVAELGLDTKQSYLVGDRWKDIAAGQLAGCETFFIDYQYSEQSPKNPFTRVSSLLEAAKQIIGDQSGTNSYEVQN